ncbi:MAG: dockerin type I repeat-containing protein, partial [Clostridia bacterium]|nr:dockerin type I repeat-containing protein [Clostridia bacterium]
HYFEWGRLLHRSRRRENPSTPPASQPIPSGWNPRVTIKGSRISGIQPGTTVDQLISSLGLFGNAAATATGADGSAVSGALRTGCRLHYYDGSRTTVFIIVLYGDCNGDSAIDAIDLLATRRCLLGLTSLTDEYLEAADTNHDGTVDAIDLLLVRRYLLNLSSIEQ